MMLNKYSWPLAQRHWYSYFHYQGTNESEEFSNFQENLLDTMSLIFFSILPSPFHMYLM